MQPKPLKRVSGVDDFNNFFRQKTLHPLVGVGNLAYADLSLFDPTDFGMYCIVLMDSHFGRLVRRGRGVDYAPGTIFSLRPGQEVHMELNPAVPPRGWMLAFREELLIKSGLGRDFYMFNYFDKDVPQALTLSSEERELILRCFSNLQTELHTPEDKLRNHMVRLNIGILLSYCKRFFERQFTVTRQQNTVAERFETMIDNYISCGQAREQGLPTVAWCADQFNVTANYFGDLVKKHMQVTAKEFILQKVHETAKHMLRTTSLSITEIAQELGFAYSNHFTRMFQKREGRSPSLFRSQEKSFGS